MAFLRLKQEWNCNLRDFNITFLNFYKCWINIYSGFVTSLWRQTEPNADTQGRDRVQDFKKRRSWRSKPENKNLKPNTVQEVGRKTTWKVAATEQFRGRHLGKWWRPRQSRSRGQAGCVDALTSGRDGAGPGDSTAATGGRAGGGIEAGGRWSCRQQRGGSGLIDGLTRAPSGDGQRRGSRKRLGGLSWASRNTDRQRKQLRGNHR